MAAFTLNKKSKFDLFIIVIGVIATVSLAVKAITRGEPYLGAFAFMSLMITAIYAKYSDISDNI